MIAIPTAEYARRADFYDNLLLLEKPVDTIISMAHGQSPARNRNLMISQALENNCTHVFFMDDDVAFESNSLIRLLSHDKDIVSGLYLMRNFPHQPIIFDYTNEFGACAHHYLQNNETGLVPVVACGLGFVLIKTEVFRTVEPPWITLGELEKDHWCDDISFFKRVREKGFKLFCDLDVQVGHFASLTVTPKYIDGKWTIEYHTNGTSKVSFPVVNPTVTGVV